MVNEIGNGMKVPRYGVSLAAEPWGNEWRGMFKRAILRLSFSPNKIGSSRGKWSIECSKCSYYRLSYIEQHTSKKAALDALADLLDFAAGRWNS